MLSRVAERLYWMMRYLERTENMARLVNVHTLLLMDLPEKTEVDWFTLIRIVDAEAVFKATSGDSDEIEIMQFMIADRSNLSSLMSSFAHVRENARTSLDFLPEEVWEQVNQTYMQLQAALPALGSRHRRQAVLRGVMAGCQRIRGILDSNMSRDQAYDFIQMGKHIERADMGSRTLEMTSTLLSEERSDSLRRYEGIVWNNLLAALGARQMYVRHKNPRIHGPDVLSFLTMNRHFPHSLRYSLLHINACLGRLPDSKKLQAQGEQLLQAFERRDVATTPVKAIPAFMDHLQADLTNLHVAIAEQWFHPLLDFSQYQHQTSNTSINKP